MELLELPDWQTMIAERGWLALAGIAIMLGILLAPAWVPGTLDFLATLCASIVDVARLWFNRRTARALALAVVFLAMGPSAASQSYGIAHEVTPASPERWEVFLPMAARQSTP